MMDSDDSDFYIDDNSPSHDPRTPQLITQNLQTAEMRLNENEDQEIENKNSSEINRDCAPEQTKINCKILNIRFKCQYPIFHFEINKKVYLYTICGMRADHKLVFRCSNRFEINNLRISCSNLSFISVSEILHKIIKNKPNRVEDSVMWTKINLNFSDPKVYDTKNYDVDSFEIGKGHKCTGHALDLDITQNNTNNKNDPDKVKCELVKIAKYRGHPSFHFKINEKVFFYGIRGINADYKITLFSNNSYPNMAYIYPSELMKKIIKNSPRNSKYSKFLNKSNPKVYDIQNYDINSFQFGKSQGT